MRQPAAATAATTTRNRHKGPSRKLSYDQGDLDLVFVSAAGFLSQTSFNVSLSLGGEYFLQTHDPRPNMAPIAMPTRAFSTTPSAIGFILLGYFFGPLNFLLEDFPVRADYQ
jgi:hypothetical protein